MTEADSAHPYRNRPARTHWRRAFENKNFLQVDDWYEKRFDISERRIATGGSCFAQHIGRNLRKSGFDFLDAEPPPELLPAELRQDFGYEIYSARYGNIYTSRQLKQLIMRTLGEFSPRERAWGLDGGWVDPFRPTIEPSPFESEDEVEALRRAHLAAVAKLFEKTQLFVFTLGLTETWISNEDGANFPIAPGVSGGTFEAHRYRFVNLDYEDVLADMRAFIERARSIVSDMHFLLTVSPVPLAATATDDQVLVATTYSKSVLRAVAGKLKETYDFVDYYPSYEIISSHLAAGMFYEPDRRRVATPGVDHVMKNFFKQHPPPAREAATRSALAESTGSPDQSPGDEDVICDEELLTTFGDV